MTPMDTARDACLRRAERRVGQVIGGKWRITRALGVGGMAAVYQAVHCHNQRVVALKVLHEELAYVDELRERFCAEARVANVVRHPGVVPFWDDGEVEEGVPFLVMDYLEGETLEGLASRRGGRLPVVEVLRLADEVLDILASAHDALVVHRDIKPDNIFLTRDGTIKLLDFGIARAEGASRTYSTEAGCTMGTPAFMPPEQARGHWSELDARSDLFSLAAAMFSLVTGEVIHHGSVGNEMLLAAMCRQVPGIRSVDSGVPSVAARVIDRALRFEKEERFATARDMQEAVRVALAALEGRTLMGLFRRAPLGGERPPVSTRSLAEFAVSTQALAEQASTRVWARPWISLAGAALLGFATFYAAGRVTDAEPRPPTVPMDQLSAGPASGALGEEIGSVSSPARAAPEGAISTLPTHSQDAAPTPDVERPMGSLLSDGSSALGQASVRSRPGRANRSGGLVTGEARRWEPRETRRAARAAVSPSALAQNESKTLDEALLEPAALHRTTQGASQSRSSSAKQDSRPDVAEARSSQPSSHFDPLERRL